jgi:hypothetical protein
MSIIEINQKIKKIQDLCYKLNEIDFKDYCITNQFKNLKRSPNDFDYVKNLKFDIDELDDDYMLITLIYTTKLRQLTEKASMININLYEDENLDFFIKQYGIVIIKEKSSEIEI